MSWCRSIRRGLSCASGALLLLWAVPSGAVSGTVLDAAGKPVAGAQVLLHPADGAPARSVTTNASGRFQSGLSVPGDWPVHAHVVVAAPGKALGGGPVGKAPAVIRLGRSHQLQGLVRDAHGRPVARVSVRLLNVIAGSVPGTLARPLVLAGTPLQARFTTRTGADGRWSITDVPAEGRAEIAVEAPDFVRVRSVVPLDREASIIIRTGGTLTGRVVRPDGKPAAGIRVSAWSGSVPEPVETTITNRGGGYRLTGLSTGVLVLSLRDPNGRWVSPRRAISAREGEERKADFSLASGGKIEGRVIDSETGKALAGVELRVQGAHSAPVGDRGVRTEQTGRFTLRAAAGQNRLSAVHAPPGFLILGWEFPVRVTEAETIKPILRLQRGLSLSGTVSTSGGKPASGLELSVHREGSRPEAGRAGDSGIAVTDKRGRFTVTGLAPGTHRLEATGFRVISPRSVRVPVRGTPLQVRVTR